MAEQQQLCWVCFPPGGGAWVQVADPRGYQSKGWTCTYICEEPPEPPPPPPPPEEEEEEDPAPHYYTIDVPGLFDVVKIPALESKKLRRQQIARMKTAVSPIPEPLRWIPSVINFLDDAQDLLISVLLATRWIIPRLGARVLPGVGWVLAANDLLNLLTLLLSTTMGGRSFKRASLRSLIWVFTRRAWRLKGVADFLARPFPWTSFLLQAGQVSRDWTGYGLQLGAVMGMVTGAFWGAWREIMGERVVFRGPPPADPVGKAARFMAQYPQHAHMQDILTPDEHAMLILAGAFATDILRQNTDAGGIAALGEQIGEAPYPLFEPWNEASKYALDKEGVLFGDDPETGTLPYVQGIQFPYPPASEVIRPIEDHVFTWEDTMKQEFGATNRGTVLAFLHNVMAIDTINWANRGAVLPPPPPQEPYTRERLLSAGDAMEPLFEEIEIDWSHAVEYGVFPNSTVDQELLYSWLTLARNMSLEKGLNHASFEDLKTAAVEVLGGFRRGPFKTFSGPE